jgi:NAD+ diphosphatase
MNFCIECGTKLEDKYLENEGMIPFCPSCNQYRFPIFNTAVSMIVMNESMDHILLIKQYGRDDYILVAGYVNKGESAEDAVIREVKEEIGLDVINTSFNKSEYYERSNTLMLNFMCIVSDMSLNHITEEVDSAKWFDMDNAKVNIKNNSLAEKFLLHYIKKNKNLVTMYSNIKSIH